MVVGGAAQPFSVFTLGSELLSSQLFVGNVGDEWINNSPLNPFALTLLRPSSCFVLACHFGLFNFFLAILLPAL